MALTTNLGPLSWQEPIVDLKTGRPTQYFIQVWNQLLTLGLADLDDVRISNPTNGQVLTYSEAEKKWIPS